MNKQHTEPVGATPSVPEPNIANLAFIVNMLCEDHDALTERVATLEARVKRAEDDL